ncbi:hypothetical protein GEMRC1_007407 [Eukaryota sp. GEM-RC1]
MLAEALGLDRSRDEGQSNSNVDVSSYVKPDIFVDCIGCGKSYKLRFNSEHLYGLKEFKSTSTRNVDLAEFLTENPCPSCSFPLEHPPFYDSLSRFLKVVWQTVQDQGYSCESCGKQFSRFNCKPSCGSCMGDVSISRDFSMFNFAIAFYFIKKVVNLFSETSAGMVNFKTKLQSFQRKLEYLNVDLSVITPDYFNLMVSPATVPFLEDM